MNKVVHFEIPTKDLGRAKQFYGEVFGWQLTDVPDMDYTMAYTVEVDGEYMLKESGAINGGLTKDDRTARGPVLVLDVESLDAKLKEATAAGAKIIMDATPIEGIGTYARIEDPEGNIIGLMESKR